MIAAADQFATADVSWAIKVIMAVVFTILAPALGAGPRAYATVRGPAADAQLSHLGDWLTQMSWIILTVLFA